MNLDLFGLQNKIKKKIFSTIQQTMKIRLCNEHEIRSSYLSCALPLYKTTDDEQIFRFVLPSLLCKSREEKKETKQKVIHFIKRN